MVLHMAILPAEIYSRELDVNLLRKGWKDLLGENEVFGLTFAVNSSKMLQFLETRWGKARAEKMLQKRWQSILDRVDEERMAAQLLAQKLRTRKKQ